MEFIFIQLFGVAAMTAIVTLLIVFNYKEYRIRKRTDIIEKLIDNGYEHDKIDINKL